MIGSSAVARQQSPVGLQQQRESETFYFRGAGAGASVAGNKKPYTFASQPQALSIRAQTDRDEWVDFYFIYKKKKINK